jgi:hypothetical protein
MQHWRRLTDFQKCNKKYVHVYGTYQLIEAEACLNDI